MFCMFNVTHIFNLLMVIESVAWITNSLHPAYT